ncbi:hypothetical protein AX15_007017 [Amanita polypyramis BW_CC]|nr:hypothetical protein AX15_007017 [Amanita polypyramis BW_CC]
MDSFLSSFFTTDSSQWRTWAGDSAQAQTSYCHHDRTPSTGSTEYWVWNGPDGEQGQEPQCENCHTSPTTETTSTASLTEIPETTPRQIIDQFPTDSYILEEDPYYPCTTTTEIDDLDHDSSSTSLSESSVAFDLPPESFSPLLRANRLTLDADISQQSSRLGLVTSDGTGLPHLFGLGIYDLTRKEDPSHAFDGLGTIHIQSSPWRSSPFNDSGVVHVRVPLPSDSHDGGDSHLSDTFLHDLEAFFLVRDSKKPAMGEPTFEITSEGMDPVQMSTPKSFAKRVKHALSLAPRRPSHPPSNLYATVSGPNLRTPTCSAPVIPRSATTSTCRAPNSPGSLGPSGSSSSGLGSTFIRKTCSAFRLRSRPSVPVISPRNVTVSVSMGPDAGSSAKGSGMGNRSLQNHSVRDLSVAGTISSDLKKRVPVSVSMSRSSSSLRGG